MKLKTSTTTEAGALYWLWAIPHGKSDRLDEKPLTSMALTSAQVSRVMEVATRDGWHSFRAAPDDNSAPTFYHIS